MACFMLTGICIGNMNMPGNSYCILRHHLQSAQGGQATAVHMVFVLHIDPNTHMSRTGTSSSASATRQPPAGQQATLAEAALLDVPYISHTARAKAQLKAVVKGREAVQGKRWLPDAARGVRGLPGDHRLPSASSWPRLRS